MQYPLPIARLIESYMKLPGIGEKTATRLAFYTLDMPQEDVSDFSKSLMQVKSDLHACSICGNITESDPCEICRNPERDQSTIMVVEQPKDVMAFEEMGEYNGLYHVLGGVLSPMDGVGPEEINIKSLITRLQKNDDVKEIILALNSTPEGESTAMYISKLIKPAGIKVSRLAAGLAVGSDIEYANAITLKRAVQGRTTL
ncbi:recombination mediator RecR [Lactobacillus hominis]|uniref:Recombination protein RecR n=1 Tax=Lactobacillus hominis DSM 23910 = CRBIP 24.179 TaxID=1423758 RepID=I7IVB6_9LACO|nr:recombination mediator RecR [Lactobacillus hominis]KRM85425.1 recombination protein R [Lactobacillus hominis DSM 23910 = CRBIP 24.179]MCT3347498.1 recombination protein RecR [Lactobacillus hominis]CCI81158.1 Recombination protein recR [Lactobacillus hominis DSM 23910 = CRBIP 24.179]